MGLCVQISVWTELQKVQKEISDLETRKNVISANVRALVVSVHIYAV